MKERADYKLSDTRPRYPQAGIYGDFAKISSKGFRYSGEVEALLKAARFNARVAGYQEGMRSGMVVGVLVGFLVGVAFMCGVMTWG